MFKAKQLAEAEAVKNSYLWKKLWEKIEKLEKQATERCCTGADEKNSNTRFSVQYFQGRWKMSQDIKRLPTEIIEEIKNLKE